MQFFLLKMHEFISLSQCVVLHGVIKRASVSMSVSAVFVGFMLSRLLVVDILVIMIGWLQLSAFSSSCYCFFPRDDHIMLVVIAEVNTHHTVCHCQKHRLLRLKFLWIHSTTISRLLLLFSEGCVHGDKGVSAWADSLPHLHQNGLQTARESGEEDVWGFSPD